MDGLTNNLIKKTQAVSQQTNVRDSRIRPGEAPPQGADNFQSALSSAISRQNTVQQISQTRQPVAKSMIQFSKHANMRLSSRQITLTGEQLNRVEEGLTRASEKGISDSLVLVDDVALVVNVKSKTVITALNSAQENIFSNIDGAVIV